MTTHLPAMVFGPDGPGLDTLGLEEACFETPDGLVHPLVGLIVPEGKRIVQTMMEAEKKNGFRFYANIDQFNRDMPVRLH